VASAVDVADGVRGNGDSPGAEGAGPADPELQATAHASTISVGAT
jgi:hypothetical protein